MSPVDAKITRLFKAGKSDAEIAAAVGLAVASIPKRRYRLDLRRPEGGRNPLDREFILREYDSGDHDPRSIARKLGGGHPDSVSRILRHARPSKKTRRRIGPEEWAHAEEMLKDGMPYSEVSRIVNINLSYLRRRLPGLGVRPEDHWAWVQARKLEERIYGNA